MLNPFRSKPTVAVIDNPRLIVHTQDPYNAEPSTRQLRASFIAPTNGFYVRSHGAIPAIETASHRLHVTGRVGRTLELAMGELRDRFPAQTDECHVEERTFHFGVSIPMTKALGPEVLLAFEMNGAALTAKHGAPLRVVVPGYAGVRSPKWLHRITVQDTPSDNPIQANDYKLFPPDVTKETADPAQGITINGLPVNSAICEPVPHARLPAGPAVLRGYATATGRAVVRVDVSIDGGRSWSQAQLEDHGGGPWSWTFWNATLDLPEGEHDLTVRAWDDAGQTQPALPDDTWNHRGYLSAAWHRVPVLAG